MNYITNSVLDHGMGSRVLKTILLMGYTNHLSDTEFIYTPLTYEADGINFNTNQLKLYNPTKVINQREEYLEVCNRWENMLGFNGLTIKDIDRSQAKVLTHPEIPTRSEEFQQQFNIKTIVDIKNKFTLPEKVKKEYIDVAIHIRRGDVSPAPWSADRWLDDEYYLGIIKDIEDTLGDKCEITIYTQRGNFNHKPYRKYKIIYDNESLDNDIWVKLVNADILVMGLSSFSYSAALLSIGLCIYPPRHISLCGPKICDDWVLPTGLKEKLKEL